MLPNHIIPEFDDYLVSKDLRFEAVIIGGAALSILGIIKRETQDCDVLHPEIPQTIKAAAQDFAKKHQLDQDWLNNGPETLKRDLPAQWMSRLQNIYQGRALKLQTLGRADLIATKLYAYCDRGFDLDDCLKLNPSHDELEVPTRGLSNKMRTPVGLHMSAQCLLNLKRSFSMAFKRVLLPDSFFVGEELTRAMAGIGMRVSCHNPLKNPNIEDVLLSASLEGLKNDWRTLSLTVDWFLKHYSLINADRLTRALAELKENRPLLAFWSALAELTEHDVRFRRMRSYPIKDRVLLGGESSRHLLKRNGEDQRFLNTKLIVPNGLLRSRPSDILDIEEIVRINSYAYYRIMMGATYRSDLFATLNSARTTIIPSDLARTCYCAFKTAWDALRDWKTLQAVVFERS